MSITEFLLARIAEDERRLSLLRASSLLPRGLSMRKTLNLALRDCDAKRQIVAWLTQQEYVKRFGSEPPSAPMLLALAAVYAEHPDYQQKWAL